MEIIQSIDETLMLFIQNHLRLPGLNTLMVIFTYLGTAGTIWIVISLCLICQKKFRKIGLTALITMGLCYVLNDMIIKELIRRPRPFLTVEGLTTLVGHPGTYSFPSGHACSSFCSAYLLTRLTGRWTVPVYLLALLIALSRPYVGVHYVSDILAGALIGTLGAAISYRIVTDRIIPREKN